MLGAQIAVKINKLEKSSADLLGGQPGGWRQTTTGTGYEEGVDPVTGWPVKKRVIQSGPAPLSTDQNKLLESIRRQNADYQSRIMKLRTEYDALQAMQKKLQDSSKAMKSWAPSHPSIHVQSGPWETGFGKENLNQWLAKQNQPTTTPTPTPSPVSPPTPATAAKPGVPSLKPPVSAPAAPRKLWTLS